MNILYILFITYSIFDYPSGFLKLLNIVYPNQTEIVENGGWHFSNLKSPENIEKKMFNFGHHNEVEQSGLDLERIKEMIMEKKVYYNHLADKTQEKYNKTGYKLKKVGLVELPNYLVKNFEIYKEWFDN